MFQPPPLPAPANISGRNFWVLGSVRRWRAAGTGQPEPELAPDDEHLLTSRQVRVTFGNGSEMRLHRRRYAGGAKKTRDTATGGEAA
jgi:hypothetical protein